LQKEHLPLNEIRRQLAALSNSQVVQALSRGTPASLVVRESAGQYIQSVKSSAGSRDRMPYAFRDAVASLTSEPPTRSSRPGMGFLSRAPCGSDNESCSPTAGRAIRTSSRYW
jgi:hypothetical protein